MHLTNALSLQLGMVGHSAAGEGEEEGVKGFKGTRSVTCKQKKGNNNNNRGGGGEKARHSEREVRYIAVYGVPSLKLSSCSLFFFFSFFLFSSLFEAL